MKINMEGFTAEGLAKKDREKEREKARKEGRDLDGNQNRQPKIKNIQKSITSINCPGGYPLSEQQMQDTTIH
jgi:hypothetical protein